MTYKNKTFRRAAAAAAAICLAFAFAFAEETGADKLGFGTSVTVSAAETYPIDSATIIYEINNDNNVTITSVNAGNETDIVIPETIPDVGTVTTIGSSAFRYNCQNLESITLPDSITKIKYDAFRDCLSLKDINIPDKVEEIGENAFRNCPSLTGITLPPDITDIGIQAFQECTSLKSIIIPSKVASASEWVFHGCTNLETIIFPYNLLSGISWWDLPTTTAQLTYTQDSTTGDVAVTFADNGAQTSVNIPANISGGTVKTVFISKDLSDSCTVTVPAGAAKITYEKDANDKVTITKVEAGDQTSIEIPGTIDGGTVTTIGEEAFKNCTTLTSITLPDSITSIGISAFMSCSSLQNINIPKNVTSIGMGAFAFCHSLDKIELPSNIISIEDMTFQNCQALKTITIPDSVESIGSFAFSNCEALADITIPDSVKSIGEKAFCGCSALTSFTFPYNTTVTVPKDIFTDCGALETVFLPYGIDGATTNIPKKPAKIYYTKDANSVTIFKVTGEQTSIEIPETIGKAAVTTIGDSSFNGCKVESIKLPTSVTSIGSEAFWNCSELTEINIPYGVQSIADSTFYNCRKLDTLELPQSIASIGDSAFYGCEALVKLELPQTITSIESNAFYGCEHLKSINIPDNVPEIKNGTFYGCRSLTAITIPSKVTSIGDNAFYGCSQLYAIEIPDSVTEIGMDAFVGCDSLTSVVIPYSVRSIGTDAFATSGIKTVFVPKPLSDITSVHQKTAKIVYTKDANGVTINQSETGMQTSIVIPETINGGTVRAIDDNAFNNTSGKCSSLESITLPAGISSIGEYAFSGTNLNSIEIPENVVYIKKHSFSDCIKLETVKLPKGLMTIDERAFENCPALTSINIPDSVKSIGDCAFSGCTSITEIKVPENVRIIGSGAFQNCFALEKINIPQNIQSIELCTFSGCKALKEIDIPDSVQTIKESAFAGCTALTSVTIPQNVISIEDEAFANCTALKYAFLPNNASYGADFIPAGTAKIYYTKDSQTGVVTISGIQAGRQTDIIIPETICGGEVRIIGNEAFKGNTSLTSITLPDKVNTIGEAAFSGCSSLESIVIPDGVTAIESSLFYKCEKLENVTLPDSIISIGYNAFYGCKRLVSIKLPADLETIGERAFRDCTSLASADLPSKLKVIGPCAFVGCESLTSITIPDSVTELSSGVFECCTSLTDVKLPKGLKVLNSAVFHLTGIKSIVIPESVTQIGDYAFDMCTKLESIELPPNVTLVGKMTFFNCPALKNVFYNKGTDISNSKIPDTSAKTKYEIRDGYAYILEVVPDSSSTPVVIPDYICGYEVKYVEEEYRQYVSETGHTHKGGTATCTEQALCDICGKSYDSTDLTNHDADTSTWKYDENGHWNPCLRTGCEEHLNAAAHTFDNGVVTTKPTETAEGVKTYTCETCGYNKTETVPKLGHIPSAEWSYDNENHWKECTAEGCNEKLELAAHTFDGGVITVKPTESSEGVKTYTCEICGYKKTESIAKITSVIYPIAISGDVTADKPSAAAGETVNVSAPFGYDIIVADTDGNVIAKISEKGSFTMPASRVSITAVRGEVFAHMSNAWNHSYVYSYDSDMNRIKVNSDTRRGIITIDLGADYAGKDFTVYSGRKSTSKKIVSGTLDENGRYTFNAEEGKNYTLVIK